MGRFQGAKPRPGTSGNEKGCTLLGICVLRCCGLYRFVSLESLERSKRYLHLAGWEWSLRSRPSHPHPMTWMGRRAGRGVQPAVRPPQRATGGPSEVVSAAVLPYGGCHGRHPNVQVGIRPLVFCMFALDFSLIQIALRLLRCQPKRSRT